MTGDHLTVRGVVRALGLRLGDDEISGRWMDPRWTIPADQLRVSALAAELDIQREQSVPDSGWDDGDSL